MEPYLADFLMNRKIPRPIRYLLLAVIVGFIEFICIYCGIGNDSAAGAAVCFAVGVLMIVMGALAARKIHRS